MASVVHETGSSAVAFVRFCPLCDKVFNREYSYSRHVSYCRRAQAKRKGRPKPCAACSAVKLKCSLDQPQCVRCADKGLACVYDNRKRQPDARLRQDDGSRLQQGVAAVPAAEPVPSLTGSNSTGSPATVGDVPGGLGNPPAGGIFGTQQAPGTGVTPTSADLDDFANAADPGLLWEQIDTLEGSAAEYPTLSATGRRIYRFKEGTLSHDDFSRSLTVLPRGGSIAPRRSGSAGATQAARLVLHIIRAFPEMMLRRQTFPPFIHQHWHTPVLPETVATCMSIAQLFASRTPDSSAFLWRSIDAEEQRFKDELITFSKQEVLASMQALVIYTIMALVDGGNISPPRYISLARTFERTTRRFIRLLGEAPCAQAEWVNPSLSWEDWIFAESRRRIACLWFIVSRVIPDDAGTLCPSMGTCRAKPLCTSKAMWEARSREEWETERAFHEASLLHKDLWYFGALIDAYYGSGPLNAARLDAWEAGTDKMGVLMSIATSLLDPNEVVEAMDVEAVGCSVTGIEV